MLKGKVAVITGASRGIGKTIAITMAKHGASIAVIARKFDENYINEFMNEIGTNDSAPVVKTYNCDISNFRDSKETIEEIISDFGQIDILVNNAGIVKDKLMIAMKEDDFDSVINVNLKGTFNMIKHIYSHFAKRRTGRIINISSVSAILGTAGQANYVSSKAGVIGLTKTVARELGPRGITCNAIAPGFIETDMTNNLNDKLKEDYKNQIPVKRFGQTEDIANAAVFLASHMASYITGEVIKVDGGLCM